MLVVGVMGLLLQGFSNLMSASMHIKISDEILSTGSDVKDDLLQMVQTQEIFDQFLSEQTWEHYFEFNRRVETLLDRIKTLRGFRKQNEELDALNVYRSELAELLQIATFTVNPNFHIGAVSPQTLEKIKAARMRLQKQILEVLAKEKSQRANIETLLKEHLDSIRQTMLVLVILVLGGGGAFAWYLNRSTIAPLKNLMEVIKNSSGGVPQVPIVETGAPEMKELIASFNQMSAELSRNQKKLQSMFSLAVSVAHEVRNPIAAIATSIQAIQGTYASDGSDREIFSEILKEVYRVDNIITDLLVFARPKPINSEMFPFSDFSEELKLLMKHYLEKNEITLEVRIEPADLMISGDRNQLHRVFLNLLQNSIDAIGKNGKILLMVRRGENNSLNIAIEDSGPGIPSEIKEKIFDPFFSTKVKGTGLGLAIVNDIIDRHGGKIEVENGKELSGARFQIILPEHGKMIP